MTFVDMRSYERVVAQQVLLGRHRLFGEILLHVSDFSPGGLLVKSRHGIERGDLLTVQIPNLGGLEVLCIWKHHQAAGFSFQLPLPYEKFAVMLSGMNAQK